MTWKDHGRFAMRVEELTAPIRLVWSWVHEPGVAFEDAPATRVEWLLTPRENGGTTLELTETGFLTDHHRDENDGGWDAELGELVTLLEG
ncbi:SRPBCC domain-containing protein [Gemmatimonadota bacterium]